MDFPITIWCLKSFQADITTALLRKKDGQLLRGFLTVREETHITLKGLKKKQEVHFASVPLNDFHADPKCLTHYLENLFNLIDEVKNFN
jgi:hypothetical protein